MNFYKNIIILLSNSRGMEKDIERGVTVEKGMERGMESRWMDPNIAAALIDAGATILTDGEQGKFSKSCDF